MKFQEEEAALRIGKTFKTIWWIPWDFTSYNKIDML